MIDRKDERDIARLRKYAKRRFITKRLRKKQISVLKKAYFRLVKKHNCWVGHVSVTGAMPEVRWWMFCIESIVQSLDLISRKDEIPRIK